MKTEQQLNGFCSAGSAQGRKDAKETQTRLTFLLLSYTKIVLSFNRND